MKARSKALSTTLAIQRCLGSVEEKDDYLVLRTTLVPDYWYGNCLAMPNPPEPGDSAAWSVLFNEEFPVAQHRVFLVDGTDGHAGDEAPFIAAGFELNIHDVLSTRAPGKPERMNTDFVYRPFDGDSDWRSGVETSWAVNQGTHGYTKAYIERSFAALRMAVERGLGSWWGAWDGEQNVGQMGLFYADGLARFKDVETHPAYRRRGVCRTLLFHVCDAASKDFGAPEFVIVPEDDDVRRIYEALGFRFTERTVDYCRSPLSV